MSEGIVELAGEKKEEEEAAGEGEQEVVQVVVASRFVNSKHVWLLLACSIFVEERTPS